MLQKTRKEIPTIFQGWGVNAILSGLKTMTRRIVKLPKLTGQFIGKDADAHLTFIAGRYWVCAGGFSTGQEVKCPYQVGDLIWVKETWGCPSWFPDTQKLKEAVEAGAYLIYKATPHEKWKPVGIFEGKTWAESWQWRPSIFMPRWASRISLEVRSVRLEWLQDISEDDSFSEGIVTGKPYTYGEGRECFHALWDKINAKRGYPWKSNPQVWRVEFAPIEKAY